MAVVALSSSCNGIRFLEGNNHLLNQQSVKNVQNLDKYEVKELFVQKTNRRFPPYALIYQWGLNHYDTSRYLLKKKSITTKYDRKIATKSSERVKKRLESKKNRKRQKQDEKIKFGNVPMTWGEPLAVYDPEKTTQTLFQLQQYLFNNGYFNGTVVSEVDTVKRSKKINVTYHFTEGVPYTLDTILYNASDAVILNLLMARKEESLLKEGDLYNQKKLVSEREKIEFYMKDNGYFSFSRQFITYQLDSTVGNKKIRIRLTINNPAQGKHRQYVIDSVNFVINERGAKSIDLLPPENYKGTNYSFYINYFNKKIINRRIFIQPGSLYSRSNTITTQRQLANLDNFKFININYDSTGGKFIANIFTSPLERYQWSHEVGINVTQSFLGPFYNLSFSKRNIFRGMENFNITGRFGIEGVATVSNADQFYDNIEAGLNTSLTFPKFLFPLPITLHDRMGHLNPKTILLASLTHTDRTDYIRTNINLSNTFSWQNTNNVFYTISLTDISIIDSKLDPEFEARLQNLNYRLINSFHPSLVSSMSFSITKSNTGNMASSQRKTSFYRILAETGGTSLNIFDPQFIVDQGLEYFKYMKVNLDYSKNIPLNKHSSFAYRFNAGMAVPYSPNQILPYEKYFFAGGSNSIRAWRPRRLGPGSYFDKDPVTGEISYRLEQQGEVILQSNFEFRQKLIGFMHYALFVDIGNVWLRKPDATRPGVDFKLNRFYKELAVGTGVGLRFDFSFLLLRLDAGIKTYDPARPIGSRFILQNTFNEFPFDNPKKTEPVIINIGVGYPF